MKGRLGLLVTVLAGSAASAQLVPPARARADTDLVIATSRALAFCVRRAAVETERRSPGVHVRVDVVGSDVAMAALYTGKADGAVIGREATDNEIKAYAWIYGRPPAATPIGPGSISKPGLSPALAIRVNGRNPVRTVTLDQIRKAFRIGSPPPTWGELGVSGAWSGRPVHLVIPDAESGTGRFLRHALLSDVVQFDWPRVTEITPTSQDAGLDRGIDAAVARDPLALGFGAALAGGRARSLTLVAATGRTSPGRRDYPLQRTITLYTPADGANRTGAFAAALKAIPIR